MKLVVRQLTVGRRYIDLLHVADPETREALVRAMHGLVGDADPRSKPRFPGPNPVSLDRGCFRALSTKAYVACEKTDGVRACMVLARLPLDGAERDACFLLDRRLEAYLLPLGALPTAMFQGSVLDGELAFHAPSGRWHYLAFDAVMLSGVPVSHRPFGARIDALRRALAPYEPRDDDPVDLRVKEFVDLRDAPGVRARLADAAGAYDVDGAVLTPADAPVEYGRHMGLFKLKFHHAAPRGGGGCPHTVDFLVAGAGQLCVFDAASKTHVPVARPSRPLLGGSAGCVMECRFVRDGVWEPVVVRTDKATANDMFTYQKTLLNIRENLGLEDVLALFA